MPKNKLKKSQYLEAIDSIDLDVELMSEFLFDSSGDPKENKKWTSRIDRALDERLVLMEGRDSK